MARLWFVACLFFLFFSFFQPAMAASSGTAVIYSNEACGHCGMYLSNLKMFLEQKGFFVQEKNMVSDKGARNEWVDFHSKNGVPIEFQGHLTVIIGDRLALEGHVPIKVLKQVFEKYEGKDFPLLVLFQDEMLGEDEVNSYKVWSGSKGFECSTGQSLEQCAPLPEPSSGFFSLTGLTIFSGLVAGIHPCTISVLLFFLAFLFSIHMLRKNAIKIGAAYIAGVFLAYFLIGLGLLSAMAFTEPHLAAKAAAILVFALGLFNIARYFFPSVKGFSLPFSSKKIVAENAQKATPLAAFFVGIVVGVCSFGCTAGIYFSVLGFLVSSPSLGLFLLALYNVMFVAPLVVVLFLASSRPVLQKIESLQARYNKKLFLLAGVLMALMGIALWFFVGGG